MSSPPSGRAVFFGTLGKPRRKQVIVCGRPPVEVVGAEEET